MPLPNNFYFSANKLQDYLDCPRRFELRHILKQAWPAIQSEPVREVEKNKQMGTQFHLFVNQYFNGLSPELIQLQTSDTVLLTWWSAFEHFVQTLPEGKRQSELQISAQLGDAHFIGVLDLLLADTSGNIRIFDWKTNKRKTPKNILREKIQSRLYPLLVLNSAERMFGQLYAPSDLHMEYWFVNEPAKTVDFDYSADQQAYDEDYLVTLVDEIQNTAPGNFTLTDESKKCKFCNYRSLCERGIQASKMDDEQALDLDHILDIDLSDLSELEF